MRKNISFWTMLTQGTSICIPKIQRDYAQGRIGKELLRGRLLERFWEAINGQRQLQLDFVYGSKEDDGNYYPLDGQQRLTTLWLLHWFVAFFANKLETDIRQHLAKFSYETRRSSSDFCEFLCQLQYKEDLSVSSLRDYIMSQTKFSSKWTLDPTVSAMLNTLCGTEIKDQNKNEIIDGFSELFAGCKTSDFVKYWRILTEDDCPIKFYNLDMRGENLPLSDDLYIKMNARGKQLTDWENFKADLLDFVDNKEELGAEIDGCWTDLFWLNQQRGKIDAILFAFVNRYIFNQLLCSGLNQEQLTQLSLYKLYGRESNDTSLRYEDFSCYKSGDCAEITKTACYGLKKLMHNLSKFIMPVANSLLDNPYDVAKKRLIYLRDLIQSGWSDRDSFEFMPTYTTNDGISKILSPQRLVFLAVCRYFEQVENFDEEKFKDWVRFAWNISEYIRVEAMTNAYRLIDEKSEFCGDILTHLQAENSSYVMANSFAHEQIKEEIEKAKYIISNPDRKDAVLTAERFRDLHGHIGFLFYGETGNANWDDFDKKHDRLKLLFKEEGGYQERKSVNILKIFLSYCTDIKQIESWTNNYSYIYDYSWESWKANFSHTRYIAPTHNLLIGKQMRNIEDAVSSFEKTNSIYADIYRWMLETDLMENVAIRLKSGRHRPYLRRYHGVGGLLCMYPSAEGVNMEMINRDNLLQVLHNKGCIKLYDEDIFSSLDGKRLFLKGWGINFTYKDNRFYWKWDNKLYLNDLEYKPIENGISEDAFVDLLDSAIENHENIETE